MATTYATSVLKLETVYNSDYFKVEVDHKTDVARSEWLRAVSDSELRAGALKLNELLLNHKVEGLLANAQKLSSLNSESKEWLATFFYNTLSGTGVKKLARILPANLFHQISLESVITRAEATKQLNYAFKNFTKEEDALDWLLPQSGH